ncbi:hypothetical protein OEZ85_013867 [Tetradesmus obliquus]|uniref:ELMO domain-containing protein n=1 Tax=Tetradesmus obliquus TaxID=3088 RepID=A0ABY8U6E7_TETOB|nr:hypothetical protein OEZ85_013867 [Tetradesmus obliquus]
MVCTILNTRRSPGQQRRLNDASEVHTRILQAVYCAFTGQPGPGPRFGQHWGAIGFQGDDPATDLRGVGMLGLLQLLYLTHHSPPAAQKLYQLSVSARQEFPLAVVSLNISRWALVALRGGALARHARRFGSHLAAANCFYCGAFYEFYARWVQGKTMREAGFVLKQLEEYAAQHPARLLRLAAAPEQAMAAAERHARPAA